LGRRIKGETSFQGKREKKKTFVDIWLFLCLSSWWSPKRKTKEGKRKPREERTKEKKRTRSAQPEEIAWARMVSETKGEGGEKGVGGRKKEGGGTLLNNNKRIIRNIYILT